MKYFQIVFCLFATMFFTISCFSQNTSDNKEIFGNWKIISIEDENGEADTENNVVVTFINNAKCFFVDNGHERLTDWKLKKSKLMILFESQCSTRIDIGKVKFKGNLMFWELEDHKITFMRL